MGHGGVGTLLLCRLLGVPISRDLDQGPCGGGNYFQFAIKTRRPTGTWIPMESMIDNPETGIENCFDAGFTPNPFISQLQGVIILEL